MAILKNTNLIPQICKIYYAPLSDVNSIRQHPGTDRFNTDIIFLGNKGFTQIYFTPGSAELTEKQKTTEAGDVFEQSLKLLFPGEQASNTLAFDIFTEKPMLIIIYYSLTFMKVMGTIGNGARLIRQLQVSPKSSSYQLEFFCAASSPMGYINSLLNIINIYETTGGDID